MKLAPQTAHDEAGDDFDKYYKLQKEGVLLYDRYRVKWIGWRGGQQCPWGCKSFGSEDFLIENLKIKEKVSFPGLIAHLIETHHFFEGKESPYRADPGALIRVLDIEPGKDYTHKIVERKFWRIKESTHDIHYAQHFLEDAHEQKITRKAFLRQKDIVVIKVKNGEGTIDIYEDITIPKDYKIGPGYFLEDAKLTLRNGHKFEQYYIVLVEEERVIP